MFLFIGFLLSSVCIFLSLLQASVSYVTEDLLSFVSRKFLHFQEIDKIVKIISVNMFNLRH